jgi:hypothetical protein
MEPETNKVRCFWKTARRSTGRRCGWCGRTRRCPLRSTGRGSAPTRTGAELLDDAEDATQAEEDAAAAGPRQ